jgi:hypothetical protein
MYICRKFRFDHLFFENLDKLNIKRIPLKPYLSVTEAGGDGGNSSKPAATEEVKSTLAILMKRKEGEAAERLHQYLFEPCPAEDL